MRKGNNIVSLEKLPNVLNTVKQKKKKKTVCASKYGAVGPSRHEVVGPRRIVDNGMNLKNKKGNQRQNVKMK